MVLVDAANVVGSRPTGWWRDRAKAARDLCDRLRAATRSGQVPQPVVVVLEGKARGGVQEGTADGVRVVHAPGVGDDLIASLAAASDETVTLVSADRELAARTRREGVNVVGPNWLIERLPDS
jgi:rRNA-processing protein FCF1